MIFEFKNNSDYNNLLSDIKVKIQNAQIKASLRVNSELIILYWELGQNIIEKQSKSNWGDSFIKQLSKDLTSEFPGTKGFSVRNLQHIKRWFLFYSEQSTITKQLVSLFKSQANSKQLVTQINQKSTYNFKYLN